MPAEFSMITGTGEKQNNAVIYLGGLQPFFTVTKGVEKILVTMF